MTGRPMNATAAQTVIKYIDSCTEKVKGGRMNMDTVLYTARDIENYLWEDRYFDIVKTKDLEYNTLVNLITEETGQHKKTIADRITGIQAGKK